MEDISIEKRIQVLEDVIKKTTQDLDSLKEELNNKEKYNAAHIISIGSPYYYITSGGLIQSYVNCADCTDRDITKNSYVYRTKSEAKEWQIALQMRRRLQDLCEQYPVDWNDKKSNKYSIYYYVPDNKISIEYSFSKSIVFDYYSAESWVLKQFIEREGEEDIKKYLFGIGLPPRYKLEIK